MQIYLVEIYSTIDNYHSVDSVWQSMNNAIFRASTLSNGFHERNEDSLYARVVKMTVEDWTWGA